MKWSILVLSLLLANVSQAHSTKGKWVKILKKLELTEEQVTEVKAIRATFKESTKDLKGELKETRVNILKAYKEDASRSEVRSLVLHAHSLKAQLKERRFDMKTDILQVLSPEQKKKMKKIFIHIWKKRHANEEE